MLSPPDQRAFAAALADTERRTSASLDRAVQTLARLQRTYPHAAAVHAAQANAQVLAMEYGRVRPAIGQVRADAAARRAIAIDPRSGPALRVVAYLAYWRDRDPAAASRAFRSAIDADPADARTHLWYANALADSGRDRAASAEFAVARRLAPGSVAVDIDWAWAEWLAGREGAVEATLNRVAAAHPDISAVHDCLSVLLLARGDLSGYAREVRLRANARQDVELLTYAAALDAAIGAGNMDGARHLIVSRAVAEQAGAVMPNNAFAAYAASLARNRPQTLMLAAAAAANGERWGGYKARIAGPWPGDREIGAALASLEPPPLE